jgi:phosphoserine phosphatase
LKQGYAVDYFITEESDDLRRKLSQKLVAMGEVDVFIQQNDEFRKKRLLVSDMDGTIVQQETIDEVAASLDIKDELAQITEMAMRGEMDFAESLQTKVAMLKGLPVDELFKVVERLEYSVGASQLIRTMNKFGAKCVLVSGGFDVFTGSVAGSLGFAEHFSNKLVVKENKLTGEVCKPIQDKHGKEQILLDQAKALGCDLRHVMAVGDGANDLLMLKRAGTGVGYFAKPLVQEAVPYQIRHTDLTSLLYIQGYSFDEFAKI